MKSFSAWQKGEGGYREWKKDKSDLQNRVPKKTFFRRP
jgi:hypothetical protein